MKTYTQDQVEQLLTQAWRAGFMASGEGQNAECCKLSGKKMNEWCDGEVEKLMAGELDHIPPFQDQID